MQIGGRISVALAMAAALSISSLAWAEEAGGPSLEDLSQLSIDDLANIPVTSVSKRAEPLSDAAAAIFVIDRNDIHRSGATTLPEILRLAPNLQVAQVSGSGYAITARGFNGTTTNNGAGNKLLVLIDGRTVYTPLYGGVFWDLQNVLPEDIERIEVVSGPGAALWGANAVNGVINIITRSANDTKGLSVSADAGMIESGGSVQYGGMIADNAAFRVYGQLFARGDDTTQGGVNPMDAWDKQQGGFRVDWSPGNAAVTLQGDIFSGREEQSGGPNAVIGGNNILARWTQPLDGGATFQAQAYYDYNTLYVPGSLGDSLSTYDLDVQHSFNWGARQQLVWGGGIRFVHDDFTNTASLKFLPPVRDMSVANGFVQDSIALDRDLSLILGIKIEDDPFVGIEPLPNARLAWKLSNNDLLWAAVSRAVRAPTLWDRDLNELFNGQTIISGGDFQSEELIAYEAGYRAQPLANLSLSLSTYYNDYQDLRSLEFSAGNSLPFVFANMMEGHTYGLEFWSSYQAADWWKLSAGVNLLQEKLKFKPGSTQLLGLQAAGDDPTHQFTLRSSFDLPHDLELDIDARYIGALPNPAVPAYVGINARIGWHMTDHLELALSGYNLGGAHREFASPIVFEPNALLTLKWTR